MADGNAATTHREQPPKSIFRNRNFILLWFAYTTSALGDHLSEVAFLDMQDALDRPDSTRINAIMLFAFMLPFFLFGPFMGWLADRLPRKRVMIFADIVRALFMFGLWWLLMEMFEWLAGSSWELHPGTSDALPIFEPSIYALPLLFTGVFAAMFSPSRAAMLPTLIRPDQFVRGNGLMNAMGPIATIASFLLGAELVTRFGPKVNFQVDGATFLLSAVVLSFIVAPRRPQVSGARLAERTSILKGLDYCRTHFRVRELILFTVVFWTAAGAVRSMIPALVGHAEGDLTDISYYNAALGIGMLSGAFLLALMGDGMKSEVAISWAFIGAGLATGWQVLVWIANLSHWASYFGLFFTGVFGSAALVSANALLQRIVPDLFRGRVFGVKDVVSVGGLLLATGLLGIPRWTHIDDYVPHILSLVCVGLLVTGIISTTARLKRGRFGPALSFWSNLSETYCRIWARTRREGICTIPISGPTIVAANHNSTLDPFVLATCCPNRIPGYMIAVEYSKIPFFGSLVRAVECVPVTRSGVDTASVKAALRHLDSGKLLGIFPQGGVQDPSKPIKVREGVGMLALRSGAPVIPAYISGIKYSDGVVAPFFRRHRAVVRFGPPVDLSRWQSEKPDRDAYRGASEHIMDCIMALKPDGEETGQSASQPV